MGTQLVQLLVLMASLLKRCRSGAPSRRRSRSCLVVEKRARQKADLPQRAHSIWTALDLSARGHAVRRTVPDRRRCPVEIHDSRAGAALCGEFQALPALCLYRQFPRPFIPAALDGDPDLCPARVLSPPVSRHCRGKTLNGNARRNGDHAVGVNSAIAPIYVFASGVA